MSAENEELGETVRVGVYRALALTGRDPGVDALAAGTGTGRGDVRAALAHAGAGTPRRARRRW